MTYTTRSSDVQSDGTLRVTAKDSGAIHQNNTDSVGGGFQGVNITYLATVVAPPPASPAPTPTSAPAQFSSPSPTPTSAPAQFSTPAAPPAPPTVTGGGGGGGYYATPTPIVPPVVAPLAVVTPITLPNAGIGPDLSLLILFAISTLLLIVAFVLRTPSVKGK